MKKYFRTFSTAFISIMLAGGATGWSATPAKNTEKQAAQQKKATDKAAEVATLRQAYGVLSVADHDYKGHRIHAMRAIEAACKLLGTDISGDGRNREKQAVSDAQLRTALAQVSGVRATAAADNQPRVLQHLNTAINELKIALSIR